jgi:hypothetical protein
VESNSLKMKVLGEDVARVIKSAAARGEVADLERARKGWVLSVKFLADRCG